MTIGLLETFLIEPVKIEGIALQPLLQDGDRVFLAKRIGEISRGDLVLFGHPEKPSIRILLRVVGLPGERAQLSDGVPLINGQQIPEPYVSEDHNRKKSSTDEIQIPADCYLMLGDNRDQAFDSRKMGPIPRKLIYGKFLLRYWPPGSH